MPLNKSPSRSIVSTEYHVKHTPSTIANSSIKEYLQQHNQLQELNKAQAIINTKLMHPYQQHHDLDENRLVIQEEDEPEKVEDAVENDAEIDETFTKLVILGSGNDYRHKVAQHSTNINTPSYGETLDLSKGREHSHAGGEVKINCSSKTNVLGRSLCASSLPVSGTTVNRLSNNNNTINSSKISTIPSGVQSFSSTVTPATTSSMMSIVPCSQTSTMGTFPISNNSHDNLATIQSSISQHINLKGISVEGKITVVCLLLSDNNYLYYPSKNKYAK